MEDQENKKIDTEKIPEIMEISISPPVDEITPIKAEESAPATVEEEISIDQNIGDLVKKITKTNDRDEIKKLYNEFKVSSAKKDLELKQSFQTLLSNVVDEANIRVETEGSELSDRDLINYAVMAGNQSDRLEKNIESRMNSLDILLDAGPSSSNPVFSDLNRDTRAEVVDILYALIYGTPSSQNQDNDIYEQPEDILVDDDELEENEEYEEDDNFYSEEYEGDD